MGRAVDCTDPERRGSSGRGLLSSPRARLPKEISKHQQEGISQDINRCRMRKHRDDEREANSDDEDGTNQAGHQFSSEPGLVDLTSTIPARVGAARSTGANRAPNGPWPATTRASRCTWSRPAQAITTRRWEAEARTLLALRRCQ